MKPTHLLAVFLAAGLLSDTSASAFVPGTHLVNGKLVHRRWWLASLPISFVVSDRSLDLLPNLVPGVSHLSAIEAALSAWEIGPVGLRLNGTVNTHEWGRDGVNLITFADTPQNRDITSNHTAVCIPWTVQYSSGEIRIIDADIVFSRRSRFATDGRETAFDIQQTLTHELGHALGLDHSAVAAATMYPFGNHGETHQRTPESDDIAGIRQIYRLAPGPGFGAIAGQVLTTADAPVFGAHVTATDQDGVARVAAITDLQGDFTIPSLPAGSYTLHVEPLDGPVTPDNLGGAFAERRILTEFRTRFAGSELPPTEIAVTSGETTRLDPIKVEPKKPGLNPRHWVWSTDTRGPWKPNTAQLRPAREYFIGLQGEGMGSVTPAAVRVSGPGITIDPGRAYHDTSSSMPWVVFPIVVGGAVAPGPRNVYVTGRQERAVLTGALEVVPR